MAWAPRTGTPAALRLNDIAIMTVTGVLAGCGLVYEYLLAHAAGRVLGAVETVIFTMIGVMIVAMGVGAFLARAVREPFTGFAWLEVILAALGGLSVLALGGITALIVVLPRTLAETFALPPDLVPQGGLIATLERVSAIAPYVLGAVLGILVGMEIPLLARVRQEVHRRHLAHNTGTIYGADYIGAGIGAALWVGFMMAMEPARAAVLTAAVNLVMGLVFVVLFRHWIRRVWLVVALHGAVAATLLVLGVHAADWARAMEDLLYSDRVVYSAATEHQRLTVTERVFDPARPPVVSFHINGRLQFASNDEHIYHAMLTYPALAASARRESVLVIGGGDGLAVRDILRWNPKEVVVLDLDPGVVELFKTPLIRDGRVVNRALLELNQFAFRDPRVRVRFGDAFLTVDALIAEGRTFDTIIIDLPDPSHPDLNRLYTLRFYAKLRQLLVGDGAMAVQSTSPYHAREAFLSIGKTVAAAGFGAVEQYHQNVPSFGEWGFTIAVARGRPASRRITALKALPVDDGWTAREVLLAAFAFAKGQFDGLSEIEVNRLGNGAVYRYYQRDWEIEQGLSAEAPENLAPRP
jgi:spermidine synthase